MRGFSGRSKAVVLTEDRDKSASLPCFCISLVTQKRVGVFNGYCADTCFLRKASFRWELTGVWI